MPKTKISEFSATPGNNTDIDGINIAEGCPPSGINDAIRELMAQLKDFQAGTAGDSFNGPIGTTTPAAGVFTNLSASGTFALTGDQVQISEGGTGQTTANAAFNALAPSQSTHAGKYLKTDGTNTSWDAIEINTADITGTLPVANGGTGVTSSTGTGSVVLSASPTFTGTVNGAALTLSSSLTLSGGTANGVAYLNGSKVLTTGSAVTYDGTTFATTGASNFATSSGSVGIGTSSPTAGYKLDVAGRGKFTNTVNGFAADFVGLSGGEVVIYADNTLSQIRTGGSLALFAGGSEQARLTSTGLGIGTSSPSYRLQVTGNANAFRVDATNSATDVIASFAGRGVFGIDAPGVSNGRFIVTDAGNVGIGTSSPQSDATYGGLTLNGANGSIFTLRAGGSNAARIYTTATDNINIDSNGSASGYIAFRTGTGSTERMRLDSSGNLGLGVTPSAWGSGWRALQIGALSNFVNNGSGNTTDVWHNGYVDTGGNVRYLTTAAASFYRLEGNTFKWFNAPSGTAGNTISFTQAMTLTAQGNELFVGTTSGFNSTANRGNISVNGSSESIIALGSGGTRRGYLYAYSTQMNVGSDGILGFETGGTERARITSGGKLGLNTTSPSGLFTVYNTTAADFTSQANLENSSALTINSNQATSVVTFQGATGNVDKFIAVDNYGGTQYFSLGYQNGATRRNVIQFDQNDTIYFSTAGTERARITSGGYSKFSNDGTYQGSTANYHEFRQTNNATGVYLTATNASYTGVALVMEISRNTTNNTFYAIQYYNTGAAANKFLVADSGNVTNTNGSYGTISDAKMKTDIVDAGSQWADIKAVRFRKFKMKDDPEQIVQLGVVAQELEQTSPGLVEEHKDTDAEGNDLGTTTKSVKTSVLLMKAAVALQEAMVRIEQLEAKVAALEAK